MRVSGVAIALSLFPLAAADHGIEVNTDPALAPTSEGVRGAVAAMAGEPGASIIAVMALLGAVLVFRR